MKNKIYITIIGLIALFTVKQTSAQLTPMSIGTIEAGDSIMIYYSVKINDPLPNGTTQISSQGAITGSNIASSNTDDPDTGPLNDATITQVQGNQAPNFTNGASVNITVCQGSLNNAINSLLSVNDADNGQTLTWSVITAPIKGTANGFPTNGTSNGGNVTPAGLSYSNNGTSGSDLIVVQVSDGQATAQINVNITISQSDDGNACTNDVCNPATGSVSHSSVDCNDNNTCTTDGCDLATGCTHTSIDCNDNNACTTDGCNPVDGCSHAAVDCNDNNACTTDGCDPASGCTHSSVDCNDNSVCTTDGCDPATGCTHVAIDCNDNDACTTDGCDAVTGCTHSATDCNDNNDCTVDGCLPLSGCTHVGVDCNDNNVCTTDGCNPVSGCTHLTVDCNDNNACTTDGCDPSTGCTHATIDCNDNNACTTDGCDPATGCTHDPVPADDLNPCTFDGCDPATGIYHQPLGNVITVGPITGTYTKSCVQLATYNSIPYSIPSVSGATYQWSVPNGMVIAAGQGTNSISVNMSYTAVHLGIIGQMCVVVKNGCDSGSTCTDIEIEVVKPVQPASISGAGKVCQGDVVVYSVAALARASSYQWTLPSGMTGSSTTNSISVTVQAGFTGGSISVSAVNVCGTGTARLKTIGLNIPVVPAPISGPENGNCGMSGVPYSVTGAVNATSYQWSITGGATISGGQGTPNVLVDFPNGFNSGLLSVSGVNNCGSGAARSITVRGKPGRPDLINGSTTVCMGTSSPYSVPTVAGASTYNWTTSASSVINMQGSKDVEITFNTAGTNRTVTVTASNGCGTSPTRSMTGITVNNCPRMGEEDAVENRITVNPNPAHDHLTLNYIADKSSDIIITLNDIIGNTVLTLIKNAAQGMNTYEIDIDKLAKGLYMMQAQTDSRKETIKVVIEQNSALYRPLLIV